MEEGRRSTGASQAAELALVPVEGQESLRNEERSESGNGKERVEVEKGF